MENRVEVTIEAGVADVRLVRANKMNALDDAMFEALVETGERLKLAPGLRAVVLSGDGRAFCAGLDTSRLDLMASRGVESSIGFRHSERTAGGANRPQQAVMVWRELPVPVIAAVHGVAFGGGFQLALGPDLRFVSPDAKLSIMEIKWGLIPDMCGIALMRALVRDDVLRELTYTGRTFTGHEAFGLGLASRVCDDPRTEALAFAAEIAAKSPDAIRAAKRLLNLAHSADQRQILEAESAEQSALIGSPNQVEAVTANLGRRRPVFRDQ